MNNALHEFFSMYLFLFITLYMFRAHRAHHQEILFQPAHISATNIEWLLPEAVLRFRWSRGSVLALVPKFAGSNPAEAVGKKILSTPSFGWEVKPSVPCRRFTACKRFLNATWKSGISGKIHRIFLAHIVPPLATRISGETTSGESWNV